MAKGKYQEWLEPDGLLKIEGWARDGLTDEQIAHNMGISAKTLYRWKEEYSPICQSLKRGKEVVDREVENALLKRALGCTVKETIKERIQDTGQEKRHDEHQSLTEKDWEMSKAYFGYKCCYCGKSTKSLTKDHLRPLHEGGKLSRDNVVPCCKSCNSSKKDNEWMSWFQKQTFYSKERAQKICDYIDFILSIKTFEKDDDLGELVVTKETIKEIPPDTTAQIFWLKNRQPDKWRDKKQTALADKEQQARIDRLEAETEKLKGGDTLTTEDKVAKLFDAIGGALDESK